MQVAIADSPLLVAFAVMTQTPAASAVTTPEETVATDVSVDAHATVASSGFAVAVRARVCPSSIVAAVRSRLIVTASLSPSPR